MLSQPPAPIPGAVMQTLVICPSRGRPGNIAELVDCWELTGAVADLLVCVDLDDPRLEDYFAVARGRATVITGQRKSLTGWINFAATDADYDIIGMIGDDVRPRTYGWDAMVSEAMRRYGIVYGNDLHQRHKLPTHPFLDAELVRRLGWMAPPSIAHLYIDNYWRELGDRLGTLTYVPGMILEHMHPHAGKAEMDDGYREVNSRAAYRRDKRAFEAYMATEFEHDMERLAWTSSSPIC